SNYPATNSPLPFFNDYQPDQPVIHQDSVANRNVINKSIIINFDRIRLFAFCPANGQLQNVAFSQFKTDLQFAGANSRALGVEKDCNRSMRLYGQARIRGTTSRTERWSSGLMVN